MTTSFINSFTEFSFLQRGLYPPDTGFFKLAAVIHLSLTAQCPSYTDNTLLKILNTKKVKKM